MVKEKLFTVHWSLFAKQNLKDIYDYIRTDSPQNAVQVRSEIAKLAQSLLHFPFKFEECAQLPTKNKIYRKASNSPYKIVYRVKS